MKIWVKNVVLIALLIGLVGSFAVSVYYGIVISESFTDWRYPARIGFVSSCVTVACGLSYRYLTREKNKSCLLGQKG